MQSDDEVTADSVTKDIEWKDLDRTYGGGERPRSRASQCLSVERASAYLDAHMRLNYHTNAHGLHPPRC